MPARTRKRKASEGEEAGAEEILQPVKKTVRTTQRNPRVNQGQPSKGGASSKKGRAGHSSDLTANNASKKTKSASSSASNAKRELRKKADDLIRIIEDQYDSTRSKDGSGTARCSLLSSKIATVLKDGVDLESNQADDTQSIVYRKSYERLKTLQKTMDEYETINRGSINTRKPTEGTQWEQDAKDVAKVDKKAMEISLQTLNCLVLSGQYAILRPPARSGDEVEQAAWRWMEGGEQAVEDTWATMARETIKAFGGVTKLFL